VVRRWFETAHDWSTLARDRFGHKAIANGDHRRARFDARLVANGDHRRARFDARLVPAEPRSTRAQKPKPQQMRGLRE
jgi:hypothetical protein